VPVGLLGLARNTTRVRGETQRRIASTSAVKSVSGATTGVAPFARMAMR
jgi:hypothetical protein